MADELKPCPFCGGEAELEQVCEDWHINCENFKCPATSFVIKSSVQKAIEAWNTRYERTCGEPRGFVPRDPDNFGNPSFAELWCEHCDIELDPDWMYCPRCGAKVVDDDQL